ncbi:MAG: type II toxin-antitoxin system Phd/YefM family antitoxin [Crocosphaera sp.]
MLQLTLKEAQNKLPELLKAAAEGQQVIIQNNEGQDFQLISLPTHSQKPQYGSAKGIVKMLDNFDDPIEDFKDYTQ